MSRRQVPSSITESALATIQADKKKSCPTHVFFTGPAGNVVAYLGKWIDPCFKIKT